MKYQVMPDLNESEYLSLKESIKINGVLIPIEYDEDGEILDGHHRIKAWAELVAEGFEIPKYTKITRYGFSESEKRNHARLLNLERRHLTKEARDKIILDMRAEGIGYQKIAEVMGVSIGTTHGIIEESSQLFKNEKLPEKPNDYIKGEDGRLRPAKYKTRKTTIRLGDGVKVEKQVHVSQNSGDNEWYTPTKYIESARRVLGEIDLDPASNHEMNKIIKAREYFTIENDGLQKTWMGRIWMNPPFSSDLMKQFIYKLADHAKNGEVESAIVLTNNSTDTQWAKRLYEAASSVMFHTGRIKYLKENGEEREGGPIQGQMITYIGKYIDLFISEFEEYGCIWVKP